MLAALYAVGAVISKSLSQGRQETSLVKRTYQTKLITDKEMNALLGMENLPMKKNDEEEEEAHHDQTSIIDSIYKLLVTRQRLPQKLTPRARRLFEKGRKRVRYDLDIVN